MVESFIAYHRLDSHFKGEWQLSCPTFSVTSSFPKEYTENYWQNIELTFTYSGGFLPIPHVGLYFVSIYHLGIYFKQQGKIIERLSLQLS